MNHISLEAFYWTWIDRRLAKNRECNKSIKWTYLVEEAGYPMGKPKYLHCFIVKKEEFIALPSSIVSSSFWFSAKEFARKEHYADISRFAKSSKSALKLLCKYKICNFLLDYFWTSKQTIHHFVLRIRRNSTHKYLCFIFRFSKIKYIFRYEIF